MDKNLIKAGHSLVVCDFNAETVATFVVLGARPAASGSEIAKLWDLIITMVPNSPQVRKVALGKGGIIEGGKMGTVLLDMCSINPVESRLIGAELAKKNIELIDAPSSGGEHKAIDGTFSIMCDGKQKLFEKYKPSLEVMDGSVVFVGDLGAGNIVVSKGDNQC